MLAPLKIRDFRLLWTGFTISVLGDGLYFVAIAWEVYRISNVPTALSTVGVAWTLPMMLFVLIGGVVTDRFDRRHVLIASDIARGIAILVLGILSITGSLELWHVWILVAIYGTGEAFFGPAFGAILPQVVPEHQMLSANALEEFSERLFFRLLGPSVGGALVATVGGGIAFLLDAGTFVLSGLAIAAIRPLPPETRNQITVSSTIREIKEGIAFVRSQTWLWATLLSATVALLAFWGPLEVLLPYIVKNKLGGSAGDFGIVLALNGVGAVLVTLWMGSRGLPRKHVLFMYLTWGLGIGAVALYGFATETWQLMIVSFFSGAGISAGLIVWNTLMRSLVPKDLLGRVTSLDWFISIGLVPVSFAITGPIAAAIGPSATMIGAGAIAGISTLLFLLIPGIRDTEHDERITTAEEREPVAA